VQSVHETLQSCLKVNANQIAKDSFDAHLNKRPNVALNQLFPETIIICMTLRICSIFQPMKTALLDMRALGVAN